MQKLWKSILKISVLPNGLKKYVSFTFNIKVNFTDSFQFLICSLDSLVKNLDKDDFKYFSPEFDSNKLDLVKQKGSYPFEYMNNFEKFKK